MSTEAICVNCKHWEQTEAGEVLGQCHRYPPQVVALAQPASIITRFPETEPHQTCGEFYLSIRKQQLR